MKTTSYEEKNNEVTLRNINEDNYWEYFTTIS